ncbi:MAG: acyl-CoA dehydrogenase [Actinomycetota bacterium]|jgi:acyl-CoA dehydrogenase|nr:acyl-CoA dehydrogenase [Actinomycetota bacterium]
MSTVKHAAAAALAPRVAQIASEIAAPLADEVDRDARFPVEAFEALRADRLLSLLVPRELGGADASVGEVAEMTRILAASCASTALIFATHHVQVACLVRHGRTPALQAFLAELADSQLLLSSVTTEVGVDDDIGSSICALTREAGRYRLEKEAPLISFGLHADAVLATCRRSPDSPPGDQVVVLCRSPGLVLEAAAECDPLGFRGTCGRGFRLEAEGADELILPAPVSEIASRTMVPVAHILWSSAWLGIATAAVERAREFVRAESLSRVIPATATRLSELSALHLQMTELVRAMARRYDQVCDDHDATGAMQFAIAMNNLQLSASRLVVEIVSHAMSICGMAGYRQDSPYSLGRLLRDAHGAALVVSNDRIIANNAQMLMVSQEE